MLATTASDVRVREEERRQEAARERGLNFPMLLSIPRVPATLRQSQPLSSSREPTGADYSHSYRQRPRCSGQVWARLTRRAADRASPAAASSISLHFTVGKRPGSDRWKSVVCQDRRVSGFPYRVSFFTRTSRRPELGYEQEQSTRTSTNCEHEYSYMQGAAHSADFGSVDGDRVVGDNCR